MSHLLGFNVLKTLGIDPAMPEPGGIRPSYDANDVRLQADMASLGYSRDDIETLAEMVWRLEEGQINLSDDVTLMTSRLDGGTKILTCFYGGSVEFVSSRRRRSVIITSQLETVIILQQWGFLSVGR